MLEDSLEQFVRDNTEGFNSLEPPTMAWEVIEKELLPTKKLPASKFLSIAWKAAAAVLIFASAWLLNDYMDQKKATADFTSASSAEASPALSELSEAEAYYTTQISSKQTELLAYTRQHPEIIEDLKKEFNEMDKNNESLKKDLAESNADEKVIEAIVLSYRVKLEILDQMLSEMRKAKESNASQKPHAVNL
jgi:hypothetical protein